MDERSSRSTTTAPITKLRRAFSEVKPFLGLDPGLFRRRLEAAIKVAGRHADIYALCGRDPRPGARADRPGAERAVAHGRKPRFSLSLRPILADTEEAAWAKADAILETAKARIEKTGFARKQGPENEGSRRLLEAAAKGSRLDKRLWTGLAALTGRGATRPRSLARRIRSPTRSSTTTTSASRAS